ncbi:MAG: hypothetical protein PHX78_11600 [bacterium]|nr:hypothetical protein [bacterium]
MENNKIKIFLVIITLFFIGEIKLADWWGKPEEKEFSSPAGKYILKITPNTDLKNNGECKAILYKTTNGKRETVWSRNLINDTAPAGALISDSGYVITLNEWSNIGKLPIVIYSPDKGNLIKAHNLESLGLDDDYMHIQQSVSSYWWNGDSISFFHPEYDVLYIRLDYGKILMINLTNGDLLDEKLHEINNKINSTATDENWANLDKDLKQTIMNIVQIKSVFKEDKWVSLRDYGNKKSIEYTFELIKSEDASNIRKGVKFAGQLNIRELIPRLKDLLKDNHFLEGTTDKTQITTKDYYIRKVAKEALEKMGEKVEGIVLEEKTNKNLTK